MDNIYLDENGYRKAINRINAIKKELLQLTVVRSTVPIPKEGDGYYSVELLELDRKEARLNAELHKIEDNLSAAIMLERHNNDDMVDIGDIINIDMFFDDDIEEMTIKIVGARGNMDSDIAEISINSPLGRAVYKKEIGQTCTYLVNGVPVNVLIKSKENVKKADKTLVKAK